MLALLLLAMITLFVRRRFSSRWNGKRMGRLLDEDPTPYRNDLDRTRRSHCTQSSFVSHSFINRFYV